MKRIEIRTELNIININDLIDYINDILPLTVVECHYSFKSNVNIDVIVDLITEYLCEEGLIHIEELLILVKTKYYNNKIKHKITIKRIEV